MLRLVTALALARAAAETTPPGTGYSDADSCPPPEKAPFGAVVTHSCSFCATTLTKAPLIRKDAAWQSVAFANHATDAARLVEVEDVLVRLLMSRTSLIVPVRVRERLRRSPFILQFHLLQREVPELVFLGD